MSYKLVTLYGELTWAPYWRGCAAQQQDILDRAADAIRQMMITLDEIRAKETRFVKDGEDPQVSGDWTYLTRIGEMASRTLEALD